MAARSMRLETGGRIDRNRPIEFRVNGKRYTGFEGDTLASALLANGVVLTARSFKYHRPRGIVGSGLEEPASLVELEGDQESGNLPITTVRLVEGLSARTVNAWPSPSFDIGAVNQLISPFIPAGFYYKTFKWPGWHVFEPAIRRAAGLARAPRRISADAFESRHAHADVLVVGAGPAGLTAALVAGRAGARVIVADAGSEAGGSLLDRNPQGHECPACTWIAEAVDELAEMDNVEHLQSTTVWAYREHNLLMAHEREPKNLFLAGRNWRIRARQVIVATGSLERPLVFPGNDRPGVMLASAVQAYANRWAVRCGERVVVFTNNDSAYAAASDMIRAGMQVAAIVDARDSVPDHALDQVPGIELLAGHVVRNVLGRRSVRGVQIAPRNGNASRRVRCDTLAVSGGWNPTVHLFSQSRGQIAWDDRLAAFVPSSPSQPTLVAGAASGSMTLEEAIVSGERKAREALMEIGIDPAREATGVWLQKLLEGVRTDHPYSIEPFWNVPCPRRGSTSFVDLQNDVTVADLELAQREGYTNLEHIKRYTTGGMGFDQGKVGNVNLFALVAEQQGKSPKDIGTTTYRPPYAPVEFGAIVGRREGSVVLPYRHTPLTEWHESNRAVMYEAGARWRRPGYYPLSDESFQETVNREASAVRTGVGIYDGAPLGKFELKGHDTGSFLDLIYTNVLSSLRIGAGRYGLMLTDDGLILDDGVAFRLGECRYWMSTSTGQADAVWHHMEKLLQIERSDWDVKIINVTSQWSNATVCGPKAREVVAAMGCSVDLSAEAFPFMSFRDGQVAGVPARIARVSFTGESSFEINARPRDLPAIWKAAMKVGERYGITPIGSEANHVLRVEKGFLSLGHEVDGTVDPYDLGMSWVMSKGKEDFLGKRSVELRRRSGDQRRELVGVRPVDPDRQVPEGTPITPGGRREPTEGFVTACVWSVVHERWLGLALLKNGRERIGGLAHARLPDAVIQLEVCHPVFHDREGKRLRS